MSLDEYEGLFLKANIPTIHVKQSLKELKEYVNIIKNDYYDYRDMLNKIKEIFGKGLT